jgi:2-polyprenyl-6-methoxyphenol hydroxylase-like FAD-dependent oxidoreductase
MGEACSSMNTITERVPVLIAGGGPVGMTLALDLGWRGIPCLVVEQTFGAPANPRCNTTAARSMEFFRRLGVADRIRSAGLPITYPTDVAYRTRFTGPEILRFELPSSSLVRSGECRDDELWPTPEPQHRIAQIFLEPILIDHAATFPCIQVARGTRLISFSQHQDGVRAELEDVTTGALRIVEADYLVGCDGGKSLVRRTLGVGFEGVGALHQAVSLFYRAPAMQGLIDRPAWMTFSFNRDGIGNVIAIDGRDLWLNHNFFPRDHDTSHEDPRQLLKQTLGAEIDYEELGVVRWTMRRLVATRYRDRRVLLCGDAAHIWIPMAGFGMNAGIQDAADLAWMLAAVLQGWGEPKLLDAYQLERRPIGDQISRAAEAIGKGLFNIDRDDRLEEPGESGVRARAEIAKIIEAADLRQFHPVGLNFAYHYSGSPLVAREAEPPLLTIDAYSPTALPGCRLPHFWRGPDHSIFDDLGANFTLLRVGDHPPTGGSIREAAAHRGVPLKLVDVPEEAGRRLYQKRLVLVRPDQHVAWRGDTAPAEALALIDRVRGAAVGSVEAS